MKPERKKFIMVFQSTEDFQIYKSYMPAYDLESAEILAKCFRGIIVGQLNWFDEEIYYEEVIKDEMMSLQKRIDEDGTGDY
jgi:hypothetical protein